jgi:flagellar biogenesis protein FliO
MNNGISSLFVFFVSTAVMIVAAYYVTVFIAKKTGKMIKSRHVALLEKSSLPGNLSIQAVKYADYVYVIALHGKDMTTLDRFTLQEWETMKDKTAHEHLNTTGKHDLFPGVKLFKRWHSNGDMKDDNYQ